MKLSNAAMQRIEKMAAREAGHPLFALTTRGTMRTLLVLIARKKLS